LGTLEVVVDDASAMVYVNERFVGSGSTTVRDLVPGTVRLYVVGAGGIGRVRDVAVEAAATTTVAVSCAVDSALRTDGSHVSLELSREASAERENDIVARLAQNLEVDSIVVLTVRVIRGRRAVIGWTHSPKQRARIFGAVQVEPNLPSPAVLANLGALLAGERAVDATAIITQETEPARPTLLRAQPRHQSRSLRRVAAVSTAIAGTVTAGVGLAFGNMARTRWEDAKRICGADLVCEMVESRDEGNRLVDQARTRGNVATVLISVGAAAIITGGILWMTAPDAEPDPVALIIDPSAGGTIGVRLQRSF
jgi:hypothetical protein